MKKLARCRAIAILLTVPVIQFACNKDEQKQPDQKSSDQSSTGVTGEKAQKTAGEKLADFVAQKSEDLLRSSIEAKIGKSVGISDYRLVWTNGDDPNVTAQQYTGFASVRSADGTTKVAVAVSVDHEGQMTVNWSGDLPAGK